MKKTISRKLPVCIKYLVAAVLQLTALNVYSQYYEEKPEPEIAIGIKIAKAKIIYGPKSFYITDPASVPLQAMIRYDAPFKISSLSPYQHRYFNYVLEGGFLFCKAKVFDSVLIDPNTNTITHDRSKNATYLPLYVGLNNRSAFSVGVAMFYWKGLGAKDIWGAKFLSLGYNAKRFRINAAGEWYSQTRNIRNNGVFFSFNFLWKLIIEE